jgi:hypothetical protein
MICFRVTTASKKDETPASPSWNERTAAHRLDLSHATSVSLTEFVFTPTNQTMTPLAMAHAWLAVISAMLVVV